MATSKDFLNFALEQLSPLEGITYRMMMGEYILYYNGKIAAYLCDGRMLVKNIKSARKLLPQAPLEPPYEGAKDMLLVEDIENGEFLKELFVSMYDELPTPQRKK